VRNTFVQILALFRQSDTTAAVSDKNVREWHDSVTEWQPYDRTWLFLCPNERHSVCVCVCVCVRACVRERADDLGWTKNRADWTPTNG